MASVASFGTMSAWATSADAFKRADVPSLEPGLGKEPMLTRDQIDHYAARGYLLVPNVLDAGEMSTLRAQVDEIIAGASKVTKHTDVYDLEDLHTPAAPRVRRIKTPHKHFEFFRALTRHPRITAILKDLLGPNIRLHGSKLNMKSAGYGAAVEWHQDWAFYPHTNDDLTATGLYLDDCDLENGPLLVVPGTHKGPVFDHHANGYFAGAHEPRPQGRRLHDGRSSDWEGGLDDHPPCPVGSRLRAQYLQKAAPSAFARVRSCRRLAPARRAEFRGLQRAHRARQPDDRAAASRCAYTDAAASLTVPGLDLREPESPLAALLRHRGQVGPRIEPPAGDAGRAHEACDTVSSAAMSLWCVSGPIAMAIAVVIAKATMYHATPQGLPPA